MKECDQEDWRVSDIFGIITPYSTIYHLEVDAPVSLKAATKASLRGKKLWKSKFLGYFSKAKMDKCNHKNWSD